MSNRGSTQLIKVAVRLPAIIRDKYAGELTVYGLSQAWVLLAREGALKPADGRRRGDASRQDLVRRALEYALATGQIDCQTDGSGVSVLSVPRATMRDETSSSEVTAIDRYEDHLSRLPARYYVNLRQWGEAV